MVQIITLSCPNCGTVVAGNILVDHREMNCPGVDCTELLRFSDLSEDEQQHLINHSDEYTMEDT